MNRVGWERHRFFAFWLMCVGEYGFGDHVTDPRAFELRMRSIMGVRRPLRVGGSLLEPPPGSDARPG